MNRISQSGSKYFIIWAVSRGWEWHTLRIDQKICQSSSSAHSSAWIKQYFSSKENIFQYFSIKTIISQLINEKELNHRHHHYVRHILRKKWMKKKHRKMYKKKLLGPFWLTGFLWHCRSLDWCYGCRVDRVEYVKCLSWHLVGHQNTMILSHPQAVNTGHPAASRRRIKENKNMLESRLLYVSRVLCARWLGLTETTSVLSRELSVIFTAGNCNIGPGRGNMSD